MSMEAQASGFRHAFFSRKPSNTKRTRDPSRKRSGRSLRFEPLDPRLMLSSNQAPLVDAGLDLNVGVSDTAHLAGMVDDDGLPESGDITTAWVKVRGPGNVLFDDPSALATDAAFDALGTYLLRLEANDGQLTADDNIVVTVEAAGPLLNVDAGPDFSIDIAGVLDLDGTVTIGGSTDVESVLTTWMAISGPSLVTFDDVSAVDTTATFGHTGTYILRLEVDDGTQIVTDDVTIDVYAANEPPVVEAGVDQTIFLTEMLALDGTVTDDGRPDGTLTTTWSKVSGDGTVTFGDSSAVDTTVVFEQADTNVLRLDAQDGEFTTSDELIVTVENPPPPVVYRVSGARDFSGDPGDHIEVEHNQQLELTEGTVALTFTADDVSGRHTLFSKDATGNGQGGHLTAFVQNGRVEVRLQSSTDEVWLNTAAGSIAAGQQYNLAVTFGADGFRIYLDDQLAASRSDFTQGIAQNTENLAIGANTWARSDNNPQGTWNPFDGRIAEFTIYGQQIEPPFVEPLDPIVNQAPVVVAGPNGSVLVSESIVLDGTVSDDGLPNPPGTLTTTWSKVSGPGVVTFGDASLVETTASFSDAGTYVLRLEAHDGELTTSDELMFTVENPPPVAVYQMLVAQDFSGDPGDHIEVEHSQQLELEQGTVALTFTADNVAGRHTLFSKDATGNGQGGHLTAFVNNGRVEVRLQSAAGEVWLNTATGSIAAGQEYDLAVTFGADGFNIYLNGQLAASRRDFTQGLEQNTENLAIGANTWARSGSNQHGTWDLFDGQIAGFTIYGQQFDQNEIAELAGLDLGSNQPPVVDAGSNRSVVVSSAVTLDGTATDDRLPNPPATVTTTWSKVSGPGSVTFADSSSVDTTARFAETGIYELRLETSDGELSSNDTVTITVTDEQEVSGFFVSPSGTPAGDGSVNDPWDLQTALNHPAAVQPGDTIWLRGGTYSGGVVSNLTGRPGAEITIRSYPGELAKLDLWRPGQTYTERGFAVNGDYAIYRDLEFYLSDPDGPRIGASADRFGKIYINGDNVKFINNVLHDLSGGFLARGNGGELYGNIVYNTGFLDSNGKGHGVGFYLDNNGTATRVLRDNIVFNMGGALHAIIYRPRRP